MAYLNASSYLGDVGCGTSCGCGKCRDAALGYGYGEVYEKDEPEPTTGNTNGYSGVYAGPWSGFAETPCPTGAGTTTDRCISKMPKACPPIPDLLCMTTVRSLPFEYVDKVKRDSVTGLYIPAVSPPRPARKSRVKPSVIRALERFVDNMVRFGLPVEAVLSAGTLYCRCISNSDRLSNHSFGDAIDIVGVRWRSSGASPSRLRETIVHNWADLSGERILLRRINACLRLVFATVIDYHRSDHRDHFHCDMNRGHGRVLRGSSTLKFVQEALENVLRRPVATTGRLDAATHAALREFGRLSPTVDLARDTAALTSVLDQLFTFVASAGRIR